MIAATKKTLDVITYPHTAFRTRRQNHAKIREFLAYHRKRVNTGLHLGAGSVRIPGLINCDLLSPDADLNVDSTKLSMFENNSVDWIESHHMIEHLSFNETEKALSEWNRLLRDGGLLVLTYPDIFKISAAWIKHSILNKIIPQSEKLDYIVEMLVGSQEHEGMFHKNVFDKRRMSRLLEKKGFVVEFSYSPYPLRTTPSSLSIARKTRSLSQS
jgi:predicted SAM-dependent methyltransferase